MHCGSGIRYQISHDIVRIQVRIKEMYNGILVVVKCEINLVFCSIRIMVMHGISDQIKTTVCAFILCTHRTSLTIYFHRHSCISRLVALASV